MPLDPTQQQQAWFVRGELDYFVGSACTVDL